MRLSIESWAPEYGVSAESDQLEASAATVDLGVEVPGDAWAPVRPTPAATTGRVLFVDGVRRIDARVWIEVGASESVRGGVCASVAAGAVSCEGRRARLETVHVHRGLYAQAIEGVGPIFTKHGRYDHVPVSGDTPEELYFGIHEQMTLLETRLDAAGDADTVVFDGPLRGRNDPRGVGYVKTHHVQYLPDTHQPVVARLGDGERTPVFLIGGAGFTRWSWYLRLPGPRTHPWSGVVRGELAGRGSAADAIARASAVSAFLPRFASAAHKDGRAPQNLYPIAGLERELRHRLGDPHLLERALRVAAAESGQ